MQKGGRLDYTCRVIGLGENEIGKIKFCIYFFSINLFFLNFLEIYFLAQSTVEKKSYTKNVPFKGCRNGAN